MLKELHRRLPCKVSPSEFNQLREGWVKENYEQRGQDYVCKTCGSTVMQTTGYVSIHDAKFSDCAGGGETKQVPVPYCPECDGLTKEQLEKETLQGCVHVQCSVLRHLYHNLFAIRAIRGGN